MNDNNNIDKEPIKTPYLYFQYCLVDRTLNQSYNIYKQNGPIGRIA